MNKIDFVELQKRADKVFCLDEGDLVISVDGEKDSTAKNSIRTIMTMV